MQYRRRNGVVEAYRTFIAKNEVANAATGAAYHARPGDWIVTYASGAVVVYPNDLFVQAFEPVEPSPEWCASLDMPTTGEACPVCGDELRTWNEEYNAHIYCANCGYTR